MKWTTPRIDYAALENKVEFFDHLKRSFISDVSVTMPCKVVEYDRATHKADLQILYNYKLLDGQTMRGCVMRGITIRRMMAGGFLIDFPVQKGDTGWLIATDRDATLSKKNKIPATPASPYPNQYESGFFIPDQWGDEASNEITISGDDAQRLVIQSKDGTQRISVGTSDIKVYGTSIELVGNTKITGTLEVTGLITADSDVKAMNATHGDIPLGSHKHGNDGLPTP